MAWLLESPLRAQCTQCGLAAGEAARAGSGAWVLNSAILVLLIPVLLLFGGIFWLLRRVSSWDRTAAAESAQSR